MAKPKPAHYRGSYHVEARKVREAAKLDPTTRCWRCGLTLAEHPPHRNGRPAFWTAGHLRDATVGGQLRPEASTCNYSAGGERGLRQRLSRHETTREW